jgi:hypothetical protein
MKRFAIFSLCGFVLTAAFGAPALAAPPNITGSWVVQQSGLNGSSSTRVKLTQSGMGIVGQSSTGNGITGEFVNDSQINGKWHGPGGAGWITVYVTPNGHSFNGTWGYNGRPSNGSFVGNKVLPPSPITVKGSWNVVGAGGPGGGFLGQMICTQSGKAALCKVGDIVINGAFRTKDKVRAKWTRGGMQQGWFSFWFNEDNNSFNGVWGRGADTTPPVGRVIGQRAL